MIIFIIFFLNFILCTDNFNFSTNHQSNISTATYLNDSKILVNKKNLILSIIVKYSWDIVLPFIKSLLISHIKNCDIVIFGGNISEPVINNIKSFGLYFYEIPEKFMNIDITLSRWKIYLDFLENKRDKYNLILSIDIRDTIFQTDFFSLFENHKPFLGLSLEDDKLNEKRNKEWITNIFSKKVHESIKNNKIINGGIIWGTFNEIFEFMDLVWIHISKIQNPIDQSIINYLIYYKKFFNNRVIFSDNFGPVITLGLTERKNIIINYSKKQIINFEGQIASIVHQYDRHQDIVKLIYEKLCPEYIEDMNNKKKILLVFYLLQSLIVCIFLKVLKSWFNIKFSKT